MQPAEPPLTPETQAPLETFERLAPGQKRVFIQEVLQRAHPLDPEPLTDDEVRAAAAAFTEGLDEVALSPEQEALLDQRWGDYLQDPSQGAPWEAVKARIRRQAR